MRLSELNIGLNATIVKILGHGGFTKRIAGTGITIGETISVRVSDSETIVCSTMGKEITLKRREAAMIVVLSEDEARELARSRQDAGSETVDSEIERRLKHINIAIIGNPKCGKSAIRERLARRGVTEGTSSRAEFFGYELHIKELSGVYALSGGNETENRVRRFLMERTPDIVLNVCDATRIEESLFLTTELLDMNLPTVVALSKYDTLENTGSYLDYDLLGKMIGIPLVPMTGSVSMGSEELVETIIAVFEGRDPRVRHIHIAGGIIEKSISRIRETLKQNREELPKYFPPRYFATKLLEGDDEICSILSACPHYSSWAEVTAEEQEHLRLDMGADEDLAEAIEDQKRGFITGALRETLTTRHKDRKRVTSQIDELVTHRIWGYPIFFLIVWFMFFCTFRLGAYPGAWIEHGVEFLSSFLDGVLAPGPLRDLIIDGAIGGVGSVIVFLPNIMILYLFIAFLEDSGYLARAAFIMDRPMHFIGLHGKSFIPLIMGFGCNVPAVFSTRTIESRSSRIITMLIIPFMPCSARLPLFILLAGTFFGVHSGTVMFLLYLLGILSAMGTAKLLRKTLFKNDETPFVMELPAYRLPTLRATISHMWERCADYLRKMGGLILVASVIVWALCYYPEQEPGQSKVEHYENSYIGQIGKFCEPAFLPMGLNWKTSVSLISGVPAKEIMVSTIGVLYTDMNPSADDEEEIEPNATLAEKLAHSGDFSVPSILALLIFTMLYFPCIATLGAISGEGGWKWAVLSAVYNTALAWVLAWITYHIASLF